jgi:hypothetical protein
VTKLNGFEETFKELMPFRFEDNATVDHIKAAYRIIDEYRFKIKEL